VTFAFKSSFGLCFQKWIWRQKIDCVHFDVACIKFWGGLGMLLLFYLDWVFVAIWIIVLISHHFANSTQIIMFSIVIFLAHLIWLAILLTFLCKHNFWSFNSSFFDILPSLSHFLFKCKNFLRFLTIFRFLFIIFSIVNFTIYNLLLRTKLGENYSIFHLNDFSISKSRNSADFNLLVTT